MMLIEFMFMTVALKCTTVTAASEDPDVVIEGDRPAPPPPVVNPPAEQPPQVQQPPGLRRADSRARAARPGNTDANVDTANNPQTVGGNSIQEPGLRQAPNHVIRRPPSPREQPNDADTANIPQTVAANSASPAASHPDVVPSRSQRLAEASGAQPMAAPAVRQTSQEAHRMSRRRSARGRLAKPTRVLSHFESNIIGSGQEQTLMKPTGGVKRSPVERRSSRRHPNNSSRHTSRTESDANSPPKTEIACWYSGMIRDVKNANFIKQVEVLKTKIQDEMVVMIDSNSNTAEINKLKNHLHRLAQILDAHEHDDHYRYPAPNHMDAGLLHRLQALVYSVESGANVPTLGTCTGASDR